MEFLEPAHLVVEAYFDMVVELTLMRKMFSIKRSFFLCYFA